MRTVMMALVLIAAAGQAAAEESEQAAPPKCVTAEINPVTGHVLCIEPLGAPVEAPPRGRQAALQAGLARPMELVAQLRACAGRHVSAALLLRTHASRERRRA